MRFIQAAILAASVLAMGAPPAFAAVGDDAPTTDAPKPDNTANDKPGADTANPTADQASNSKEDLKLAAKIRRSLMKDKKLSMDGRNVKIIAMNGSVTLRGPVKTEREKSCIERDAAKVAGTDNVTSQLDVQP